VILYPLPLDAVPVGVVLKSQDAVDAVGPRAGLRELCGGRVGDDRDGSPRRRRRPPTGGYLVRVFRLLGRLIPYDPAKDNSLNFPIQVGVGANNKFRILQVTYQP
jgi:hypothetical protein